MCATEALRHCTICHKNKSTSEFFVSARGARGVICKSCISNRKEARKTRHLIRGQSTDQWDGAQALCKSIKVRAGRAGEGYDVMLDGETLRCIRAIQCDRCAISGLPLLYPEYVPTNAGSEKWRDQLPPEKRAFAVDAVRADRTLSWTAGNIMLVCHMFVDMYDAVGTAEMFRRVCRSAADYGVHVISATDVSMLREKRTQIRRAQVKAHKPVEIL